MKMGLGPDWSKEQKAKGEQMREAWEEFFSAAKSGKEISEEPLLGREEETRIIQVLARHEAELLRYPNVVAVAQGIRTKGGKPTGEPCITVYVEKKIPLSKLDKSAILPSDIEGIPVDVVEIGKVEAL